MNRLLSFLVMLILCSIFYSAHANKTFVFAYDANGNRTTLTFSSTCKKKNPKDTTATKEDTTAVLPDTAVLNKLQTVIAPALYPTLVRTDFLLSFPTEIKDGTLNIYDMNGNVLFTETGIYTSNTIVKLCDFPAGMYNVVVTYNTTEKFTQKIVKQ